MRISINTVMGWGPCSRYSEQRLMELFGERDTVTWQEICDMKISFNDKLWALLHPEFLTVKKINLLTCNFVEKMERLLEESQGHTAESTYNLQCIKIIKDALHGSNVAMKKLPEIETYWKRKSMQTMRIRYLALLYTLDPRIFTAYYVAHMAGTHLLMMGENPIHTKKYHEYIKICLDMVKEELSMQEYQEEEDTPIETLRMEKEEAK